MFIQYYLVALVIVIGLAVLAFWATRRSRANAKRYLEALPSERKRKGAQDVTDSPSTCPKCRGPMEQGFVIHYLRSSMLISHWSKGSPLSSIWRGTKMPATQIPIGMFRCSSCGYLESYARPEFAAK